MVARATTSVDSSAPAQGEGVRRSSHCAGEPVVPVYLKATDEISKADQENLRKSADSNPRLIMWRRAAHSSR